MPRAIGLLIPLLLSAAIGPQTALAQGMEQLLRAIRSGGGWVSVPIEGGRGEFRGAIVPTMGLTLNGCVAVWEGQSGNWHISARDELGGDRLEATVAPGDPVLFSYSPGTRSQLTVDFRWSESRDTTLYLWVGLELPERRGAAACIPPPTEGGAGGSG
jgi:hypothetical protein